MFLQRSVCTLFTKEFVQTVVGLYLLVDV